MNSIINAAINRSKVILMCLGIILLAGMITYITIPKEAEPDIAIPFIYVSMRHEGISPEDAERLLVKPMEKELQSIVGLKEMRSNSGEGYASVQLEFNAGFDSKKAKSDVREKVDTAKTRLPDDTDEGVQYSTNVLGESSFKNFWAEQGFGIFERLVNKSETICISSGDISVLACTISPARYGDLGRTKCFESAL